MSVATQEKLDEFTKKRIDFQLRYLQDRMKRRLTKWEQKFVSDVNGQFRRNPDDLTMTQINKLEQIYGKL